MKIGGVELDRLGTACAEALRQERATCVWRGVCACVGGVAGGPVWAAECGGDCLEAGRGKNLPRLSEVIGAF